MQRIKETDLQAEYERAVKEGNVRIAKVKPVATSQQSIEDIHYWYRYAANILIQRKDVPRHKIVGKLYEDFNQFYGERWIRQILKESNIDLPEDENGINSENNSSLYTPNAKFEQENALELEVADRAQTFVNLWKTVLRGAHYASLQDPKARKQGLALMNATLGMAIQSLDGRRLVQTPTQAHLVECALTYMPQDAYAHHLDKVKDLAKKMTAQFKVRGIRTIENITGKRLTAILTLNVKEVDESLDPASPLEAKMKGFSYQRCPKCKGSCEKCAGYRCNRLPDATEGRWYACECCDHKFEGIIIPPFIAGTIIEKKIEQTLDNFKKWKKANGISE